jgi:citrate lyase subunit beta/citryl-CoA lyase
MIAAPVSPLFVPGSRPERFAKASASAADAVIIDLEDAVDTHEKVKARDHMMAHGITGKPVFTRINAADTQWWEDDLAAIGNARLDGVILPKAETAEAMAAVARAAGPDVAVMALIETVRGLFELEAILRAPQVLCAGFGSLDFGLDCGCEPAWEPLLYARSRLVLMSRLVGVAAPIDGVTPSIDDADLIADEARRAAAMGFGGKLAIHPKQLEPISSAFRPDDETVAWAKRVLEAARDGSAIKVDGRMVDKPLIEKARRVCEASGIVV